MGAAQTGHSMANPIGDRVQSLTVGMRNVWGYLAVALAVGAIAAFLVPSMIVTNTFLASFVRTDYLSTLIVLVTVTLASITHIHVKLTVMTGSDLEPGEQAEVASLRNKANGVARFFLFSPVAAVMVLISDGSIEASSEIRAWTFSALVAILMASIAATYEVQKIVLELSRMPDRSQ